MTAGIPGIGLGGLFFVISAFLMLFVEVWLTLRGRSSPERWRVVLRQAGLAAGVVVTTVGFLWLVDLAVLDESSAAQAAAAREANVADGAKEHALEALMLLPLSAAPILVTLILLFCVLCFAESVRWFVRRPERYADDRPPE